MMQYLLKYAISAILAAAMLWGWCRYKGVSFDRIRSLIRDDPLKYGCIYLALTISIAYGGGKAGAVIIDDLYVADAGSYLNPTNNTVYVALAKKTDLLPDSTEILVYAREPSSTNVADWVRLTPHLTFADHPFAYPLPQGLDATNCNVYVASSYTPAPIVHTNGVWSISGFLIPASGGKMGFKQTRTELKPEEGEENDE